MAENTRGRAAYRGKADCIFGDGGEEVGEFCQWHRDLQKKIFTSAVPDPLDALEICNLCQRQSILRSVSFIGTCLKHKG